MNDEPKRFLIGTFPSGYGDVRSVGVDVGAALAAEAAAKIDAERATRAAIPPTRIVGEAFFAEIVSALAGCIAVDRERAVRRGDVHAVRVLDTRAWRLREGVAASRRQEPAR